MPKTHHHIPDAPPPPPTAHYCHAVEAGGWLYVTGQLPVDPANPEAPLPEGIEAQTNLVLENLAIVLQDTGFRWEHTVMARIFLTHFERDYPAMNAVYRRMFADEATIPARTTVGVTGLAREALVEIDLVCFRL